MLISEISNYLETMRSFVILSLLLGFTYNSYSQEDIGTAIVVILKDEHADLDFNINSFGYGHMGSKRGYEIKSGLKEFDDIGWLSKKPHKIAHATYYLPYLSRDRKKIEEKLIKTNLFSSIHRTDNDFSGRYTENLKWCIIKEPVDILYKKKKDEEYQINSSEILNYLKKTIPNRKNENEVAFLWYKLGKLLSKKKWPESKLDYLEVAHCYMSAKDTKGKMSPFAAYELGKMYEYGKGLPQSYYLAAHYYKLGAERGYNPCINLSNKLDLVFPDMEEKDTFIYMKYPKLIPDKKFDSKDCEGNITENITYKFEGNFSANIIKDFSLKSGFDLCYSPIYFSIEPQVRYNAGYGIKKLCIRGPNRSVPVSEQYLAYPQKTGDKVIPKINPLIPEITKYSEVDEHVFSLITDKIKPPLFPGEDSFLMEKFNTFFTKPDVAQELNISGKITISFIVEKNGALSNFIIKKGLGLGIGDEVIRVLSHLGDWRPAKLKRKSVRCLIEKTFEIQ